MSPALLAIMLLAGLRSAERFDAVFDATDRVEVVELDVAEEPGDRRGRQVERVLYESSSAADVEALRAALRAKPQDGICACIASTEIHLYRGNERLATLHYLGPTMKGDLWGADVELVSHEMLLRWFDARGLDEPRRDDVKRQAEIEAHERAEQRWVDTMPASLRPVWATEGGIRQTPFWELRPQWRAALVREFPDAVERTRALLVWFGAGEWGSGTETALDGITERLLMDETDEALAVAIEENAADALVREGAARMVCGWQFDQRGRSLPDRQKALLREHVGASVDAETRACAARSLAER